MLNKKYIYIIFLFISQILSHEEHQYPDLYEELNKLRVRELKRQLALTYGYTSHELDQMLLKEELVTKLYSEKLIDYRQQTKDVKRKRYIHLGISTLAAIVIYHFWPLWVQVYDVISVNFVVYTDRKKYETSRVKELRSFWGLIGIFVLFILDALKFWLSVSVLLSWVIQRNKYFFPIPSIPIQPLALLSSATSGMNLGAASAGGGLSSVAINMGPMLISWLLSFLSTKAEIWLGKILSKVHKQRKRQAKENKYKGMTQEEIAQRKAEKAARRAEREAKRAAAETEAEAKKQEDARQKEEKEARADAFGKRVFEETCKSSSAEDGVAGAVKIDYDFNDID